MARTAKGNRPWVDQLMGLKADIAPMPAGPERDAAERRAHQLEAAIQMQGWLTSDELKRPT